MSEQDKKSEAALREEKVLEFWRENKIFSKTLEQSEGKKEFIFYEGPPTANAKPGIHHLEARAFKDAIPRYKTMQGYHVRRKSGWDTHGLPVELQVEKKLGFESKNDIEAYGIARFNQKCKENVWEQIDLWTKFTERIGYWLDQEHPYVTYENNYIESVWSVIKKVNEQKLLYKDYKVVPWCPRCGTVLSSHELAQGYEEIKDLSVFVKLKIIGVENGYFLAWTTTPWTLPGNVALAVGSDIDYVEIKVKDEILVLAKERLGVITEPYEIIVEHKGKEMIGMQYEPLFPYLNDQLEKKGESTEKAFRVYVADFVNTEDGTGIVHTAVMYGQDDFELGTKVGLPKFHLVNPEGKFVKGTGFLEGRYVREVKADGKPTLAVDIIEDLKKRNLFFKQENFKHQYPHCWRCHTALVYYARDSWYIRMSDPVIKKKLIAENKRVNWEPKYIRNGRFGEWLREVKDWAISRERYWGTPLPVWICDKCEAKTIIGSLEDLKKHTAKSSNKYFVMRHGEAENNAVNVYSSDQKKNHLTESGREQVLKTVESLKGANITKVYCSPFLRTRETAEIVVKEIDFPKDKIIYDDRIRELEFGDFSDQLAQKYWNFTKSKVWSFDALIPGGESYQDAKNRVGNFLYDIDKKYQNETILVITHGLSVELFPAVIEGADKKRSLEIFNFALDNQLASLHKEHEFTPLPHNENYELDFHKPYIDEIKLTCPCGGVATRVKEVMDVWLDSGTMPFSQDHYPFENKKWIEGKGYPADYISEAIDQTRGWFYTLHAVGVLMGRGKAFRNVICLGHLLDAKGKKMSKSLGNVIDPWEMADKYGVDTLRLWMYSVNQPGESKNFDEKTVMLLHQQVFGLLYNVLAFYELYRNKKLETKERPQSKHILDQWILARLDELIILSTNNLDMYKLLEPTRAVKDFIGDLSTWYLRRSRERIKDNDEEAKKTLYYVLKTVAKLLAPLAPFTAEDLWQKLKTGNDEKSVHLASWPEKKFNLFFFKKPKVIESMEIVREIVTLGLEARQKAGIKVRQPLNRLEIVAGGVSDDFLEIIKDELNVKNVDYLLKIKIGLYKVTLDTKITKELEEEGSYRELLREIQDMRKKMGLTPSDVVVLCIETSEAGRKLIEKFETDMKKIVLASKIEFKNTDGGEIKINELGFKVKVDKN